MQCHGSVVTCILYLLRCSVCDDEVAWQLEAKIWINRRKVDVQSIRPRIDTLEQIVISFLDNVRSFVTEKAAQGYIDIITEIKTVQPRHRSVLGDDQTCQATVCPSPPTRTTKSYSDAVRCAMHESQRGCRSPSRLLHLSCLPMTKYFDSNAISLFYRIFSY